MALKTDYKAFIAPETGRRFHQTPNSDGTVTMTDVTVYTQEGDYYGPEALNTTNAKVNEIDNALNPEATHTKAGTVHSLTVPSGIQKFIFKATNSNAYTDTWQVNGVSVTPIAHNYPLMEEGIQTNGWYICNLDGATLTIFGAAASVSGTTGDVGWTKRADGSMTVRRGNAMSTAIQTAWGNLFTSTKKVFAAYPFTIYGGTHAFSITSSTHVAILMTSEVGTDGSFAATLTRADSIASTIGFTIQQTTETRWRV